MSSIIVFTVLFMWAFVVHTPSDSRSRLTDITTFHGLVATVEWASSKDIHKISLLNIFLEQLTFNNLLILNEKNYIYANKMFTKVNTKLFAKVGPDPYNAPHASHEYGYEASRFSRGSRRDYSGSKAFASIAFHQGGASVASASHDDPQWHETIDARNCAPFGASFSASASCADPVAIASAS